MGAIVALLISAGVFLTIIGIIASIVLVIVFFNQSDPLKKAKLKKWAVWTTLGPIFFIIFVLVIWGLINVGSGAVKG